MSWLERSTYPVGLGGRRQCRFRVGVELGSDTNCCLVGTWVIQGLLTSPAQVEATGRHWAGDSLGSLHLAPLHLTGVRKLKPHYLTLLDVSMCGVAVCQRPN